jgi:NAD(P)-dependent dehydrogenase (short-subunit alcohol dehydrogenase family)
VQRLSGKSAVVTGRARGIGAAIARRLATEGTTVAVPDCDQAQAARMLPAPHINAACDVSLVACNGGSYFS